MGSPSKYPVANQVSHMFHKFLYDEFVSFHFENKINEDINEPTMRT